MARTVVQIRIDTEEKSRWLQEAKRAKLSLSEWIRRELAPQGWVQELPENERLVMNRLLAASDANRVAHTQPPEKKKPKLCPRCQRVGAPACAECRKKAKS